jgi:hypothetical protein
MHRASDSGFGQVADAANLIRVNFDRDKKIRSGSRSRAGETRPGRCDLGPEWWACCGPRPSGRAGRPA